MNTAADTLAKAGCTVVDEWEDHWTCGAAAIGHTEHGRWAFVDVTDEGTCPGCATEEVGEVVWCDSEDEARRLFEGRRDG
jgi:hypothetical protein